MKAKNLTENDLKYIQENLDKTASELSRILAKPRPKIAKLLKDFKGVSSLGTKKGIYTSEEISTILEHKDALTYSEIANMLGKGTSSSVHRTILKYAPNHKKSTSKCWTEAQNKLFRDNYYNMSNMELAHLCDINPKVIQYNALRLGLDWTKRNRTGIEYLTATYLDSLGISYVEQWSFSKYRYDFYISSKNLLIEVQGDYWHGNPTVYKEESSLNDTQLSNIARDILKKDVAEKAGYKIVYLWEKDIQNNILNLSEYFSKNIL